jgi:hypothetical protein
VIAETVSLETSVPFARQHLLSVVKSFGAMIAWTAQLAGSKRFHAS